MLMTRDPLSETVHLTKSAALLQTARGVGGDALPRGLWYLPLRRARGSDDERTRSSRSNTGRARAPVAKRSSFYLAMRILPPDQRQAMYAGLRLLPRRRRYRRRRRADRPRALPCSIAGAPISPACTPEAARPALPNRWQCRSWPSVCGKTISSPSSTAWKWTSAATSARPIGTRFDLYCDRVASAVGRLSVKIFGIEGEETGNALSHHLGRALQMTNILRDLDEDANMRPALSSQRGAGGRGYRQRQYRRGPCPSTLGRGLRRHRRRAPTGILRKRRP